MSRSSATSRCCCNCCSGTTPCSRRCRPCAKAWRFRAAASSTTAACSCRSRCSSRASAMRSSRWGWGSSPRSSTGPGRSAGRWRPASRRRCYGSRSGSSSRCRLPFWRCRAFRSRSTIRAGRFNIRGGMEMLPEFMALLFGLVIYTAAFIAEVVRAGILAVSPGARPRPPIRSACGPGRPCASW